MAAASPSRERELLMAEPTSSARTNSEKQSVAICRIRWLLLLFSRHQRSRSRTDRRPLSAPRSIGG